jgi:hypothetical protein
VDIENQYYNSKGAHATAARGVRRSSWRAALCCAAAGGRPPAPQQPTPVPTPGEAVWRGDRAQPARPETVAGCRGPPASSVHPAPPAAALCWHPKSIHAPRHAPPVRPPGMLEGEDPREALEGFQQVASMESEKGEW